MHKVDNLKVGQEYLFVTKENDEFRGVFLDKDEKYVFLKNVKHGAKFTSLFCLPIDMLARAS